MIYVVEGKLAMYISEIFVFKYYSVQSFCLCRGPKKGTWSLPSVYHKICGARCVLVINGSIKKDVTKILFLLMIEKSALV